MNFTGGFLFPSGVGAGDLV